MSHHRPFVLAAAALLACAALGPGCRGDTPEAAFKAFITAVRAGDRDAAWEAFSKKTQRALEAYLGQQRPPGAPVRAAKDELFDSQLLMSLREILYIDVLTQSGGRAVLEIVDENEEKQQVTMVLEEGRWCLELPVPAPPGGL